METVCAYSNEPGLGWGYILLLHHFLGEDDLNWLKSFGAHDLNDAQKQALLFVREVGAIDNHTYRQMADCDTLRASNELRILKAYNLLISKGRGKSTYYVPGQALSAPTDILSTPPPGLSTPPADLSTPPPGLSTPPSNLSAPPQEILDRINNLNEREHDTAKVEGIVMDLCRLRPMKAIEIAAYLNKTEGYVKRKYLSEMIGTKKLKYLHPEMINHPEQAYLANSKF